MTTPTLKPTLRQQIVNEVLSEREYNEEKWGNEADDTKNRPNDWIAYIASYSTRWFTGGFSPYKPHEVLDFRKCMIKVAAIAIAAVESLDRQQEKDGRAFYEQPRG